MIAPVFTVIAVLLSGMLDHDEPISSWRFASSGFIGGVIEDPHGGLDLQLEKGGLHFTGESETQAVLLDAQARALDLCRACNPDDFFPSDAFTVTTWVRSDKPVEWAGILSALQDNGGHERGMVFGCNGDQFYLGVVGSGDGADRITYLFSKKRAVPNQWHHVAATYDGARMQLFVDGILDVESYAETGPVHWPVSTTIALGAYVDDDERHPLLGALHSVAVYDQALDNNAIAVMHAEHDGQFPKPSTPEDAILARTADPIVGWPTYRRDPKRSGVTPESLPRALHHQWTVAASAKPKPSWPEPAQSSFWQNIDEIVPRVVFDRCFHPVTDGDAVLFGSSADDHLYCYDLDTGALRWRFAAQGPIRFAPIIDGDGVLFASDDGTLRRVLLEEGTLVWETNLAPAADRVIGNGRLISAWPPRSGPVLDRGVLHICCGLFPRFGTWAHAIDPASGETIWRSALPQISPQGYLLASPTRLFVPTGRTQPRALGRGDGRLLANYPSAGGTFVLLVEDDLVSGPGSKGQLQIADTTSRESIASFDAEHGLVSTEHIILSKGQWLRAIDRTKLKRVLAERGNRTRERASLLAQRESGADVNAAIEANAAQLRGLQEELLTCERWRVKRPASTIALADDQLVVGTHGEVFVLDVATGEERWRGVINGEALGLAITDNRLLVANDFGALACFGPKPQRALKPTRVHRTITPTLATSLARTILDHGMDRGIAIVLDPLDTSLARALAHRFALHVIIFEDNAEHAHVLREELLTQGDYGDRVVVLESDPGDAAIDAIGNVVVSHARMESATSERQLTATDPAARLVRPDGGLLIGYHGDAAPTSGFTIAAAIIGAHQREALPGAADWTHPFADAANTISSGDTHVSGDLALRWFGGPGAERMVDRHLRTTASLAAGGRLFIPGNDEIIAVDAFNGTELWSKPLEGFSRTGAPYDSGSWALSDDGAVIAVHGDEATSIAQSTGKKRHGYKLPVRARGAVGGESEWGWLAVNGPLLFGSAAAAGTARVEQSRTEVDLQYENRQPLTTSRALFAINRKNRRPAWTYHNGTIINTTIALDDDRVVFVEATAPENLQQHHGRLQMATLRTGTLELVALDLATGKERWRHVIDGTKFEHSLYLAIASDAVLLSGARDGETTNLYSIQAFDPKTGEPLWSAEHANSRNVLDGGHGEQVHRPVVLNDVLIAEPRAYDVRTGERVHPGGAGKPFQMAKRSGCGIISASADCLFFRDGTPALIDFASGDANVQPITQSSRPGCWVNVIPAQGMVLIPESSSGCVCGYSLQTSLGLIPKPRAK